MKLLKNPILWAVLCLALGMVIGGVGWDKNESTMVERTRGAIPMIVIGCTMIVGGLLMIFILGNKRSK